MKSTQAFVEYIDDLIADDLEEMMEEEGAKCANMLDLLNMQERARVITIKEKISSTHKWTLSYCIAVDGFKTECLWCQECGIRCSVFEHTGCLSILSQVKDKLPTYTVHNEYLMHTCQQVKNAEPEINTVQCWECGMPEKLKSDCCNTIEVEN